MRPKMPKKLSGDPQPEASHGQSIIFARLIKNAEKLLSTSSRLLRIGDASPRSFRG